MLQQRICKLRELIVVLAEQCSRHGIAFFEDALDLRVDQGCHCWTLFTYCGRTRGKGIAASCFLIAIEHEATISAGNQGMGLRWQRSGIQATHVEAHATRLVGGEDDADLLTHAPTCNHAPCQVCDDLEIVLPKGLSIESRGGNGDHEVADVDGDLETNCRGSVRITRIGGNVRLDIGRSDLIRATDVKGRIDVQGGRNNDLEMENIGGQVTIGGTYTGTLDFKNLAKPLQFTGSRGTELSTQAVPGRIHMDLGEFNARDITGPMRLVTSRRDIKINQATQSLEVETQTGDIELTPGRVPLPTIQARSGSGRIELLLPDKASFQLEATADRGDARGTSRRPRRGRRRGQGG